MRDATPTGTITPVDSHSRLDFIWCEDRYPRNSQSEQPASSQRQHQYQHKTHSATSTSSSDSAYHSRPQSHASHASSSPIKADHQSRASHDDHHPNHHSHATRPPPLTPSEAIGRLAVVLSSTITFFNTLQTSYETDIAPLHYVAPEVLNYIWQDKVRFDHTLACSSTSSTILGLSSSSPILSIKTKLSTSQGDIQNGEAVHPPSDGIHPCSNDAYAVLKDLSHHLNTAVDATVHALKRSDGDNRTLAEKLSRFAQDIEGSRERVFKRREEAGVLMTELEMLAVLLKRHRGESSGLCCEAVVEKPGRKDDKVISEHGEGEGQNEVVWKEEEVKGKKKGMKNGKGKKRKAERREVSYESPSVVEEDVAVDEVDTSVTRGEMSGERVGEIIGDEGKILGNKIVEVVEVREAKDDRKAR